MALAFADQELEHLLSRVAAAESTQEDVLGEMLADGPLGLQFFPPTKAEVGFVAAVHCKLLPTCYT